MKTIAKILAFILVLVFIIVLPLSLLVFNTGRVLFTPELVKQVITDEVVNSDLIPIGLEWYSERQAETRQASVDPQTGLAEPDILLLISFLDRDDWREIKEEALTDLILTEWVSSFVDDVYEWIDGEDNVPQVYLTLSSFKERVSSEHGVNAILIAYNNLQPCTQAEIDDFQARLDSVSPGSFVAYNLCIFPEPWREDQFNDYVNSLNGLVAQVPSEFAFTEELTQVQDTEQVVGAEKIKSLLRLVRTLAQVSWLIPLGVLVLILILVVRSLKSLGRWWGFPFLVGGLVTLLPAIIYRWLITTLIGFSVLSETPEIILEEVTRTISRLASEIFQPMLYQTIVIVGAGILLIILMIVSKDKSMET
jgi:hypothetical protein